MRLLPALALVASVAAIETLFPGPWERYIQAPSADRIVRASSISYTEGNINYPSRDHDNLTVILHGHGALVTFEFPQNTGGRCVPIPVLHST